MSSAFPPLPHHKTNIKMNTMNIHTNTQHQHLPCLTKHSHPISGFRSITWRPAYVSARPVRLTTPRFMSPKHDEQGSKEIKDVLDLFEHHAALDTLDTLQQRVTDSWGWLRHAFEDPDDFSASAIGRMVSKEYGRHERPHCDHHMWRASSPVSTPRKAAAASTTAATAATASSSPSLQPATTAQHNTGVPWGFGGGRSPAANANNSGGEPAEVYHSPPSGPGFLLIQQQQQQQGDRVE